MLVYKKLKKGMQLLFKDETLGKRFSTIKLLAITNPTDEAITFEVYACNAKDIPKTQEEAREKGQVLIPETELPSKEAMYFSVSLQLTDQDLLYIHTSAEGLNTIVNYVSTITA